MAEAAGSTSRTVRLLACGALVHTGSTLLVFALGRFRFIPHIISPTGALQGDGLEYLERSIALGRDFAQAFVVDEQFHVRLYAASCAILTPVVGANILSIELISLPLYLLTLVLTYKIGEICFEPRVGLVAAIASGLFPSLLFHETQPLRDPLFIVLTLTLIWMLVRLIAKRARLVEALSYSTVGCLTLLLMWIVRDTFLLVYVGIVGLALVALLAASLRDRRVWLPNFACVLIFLAALFLIPKIFSAWAPPKGRMTVEQTRSLDEFTARQTQAGQAGVLLKINVLRQKFGILYKEAGSNIDVDRTFRSHAELVFFVPRAVLIGLYAPFPVHWLRAGTGVGWLGKVVAALETCFIYLLSPLALAAVWKFRRSVFVWYLLALALMGATALGLVVVNLGALYRMRYTFWMLVIILASGYVGPSLDLMRVTNFTSRSRNQGA